MEGRLFDPEASSFILPDGSNLWNLDSRLTKALKKMLVVSKPTLVQEQVIPLVLEGKDVLIRSKTGSGKTLAFLLPLVQKILSSKPYEETATTSAIVLVPTKELCFQVEETLSKLLYYCSSLISVSNLALNKTISSSSCGDIVISTPGILCEALKLDLDLFKNEIDTLVVDECDLILQFGCEEDVRLICSRISRTCQGILCSATLDNDLVQTLKKIVLNNPVTVKLKNADNDDDNDNMAADEEDIKQWYLLPQTVADKDLILFSLLKLGLITGKTLCFVNTIDRGYSLKLFLEQFGMRAGVLNAQLPANSRRHILDSYEAGLFDFLIATDELTAEEFGVSRGVDFKFVQTVINADMPHTVEQYVHRIGRTGRAGASGTAITLVLKEEEEKGLLTNLQESHPHLKLLPLNMTELEGFRYRVEGMRNAIKTRAIKAARVKDLKNELLNSERLQAHFQDNPRDLHLLKHDAPLQQVKIQRHLQVSAVPSYLLPPSNSVLVEDNPLPGIKEEDAVLSGGGDVRFMNHKKKKKQLGGKRANNSHHHGKSAKRGRKKRDALF